MIIDSHAHLMFPQQQQLELMSAAKIDRTILFPSIVHPETATTLGEFEGEMNTLYSILNGDKNPLEERRRSINELAIVIAATPDKYIGFGSMPLGFSYQDNLSWITSMILAHGFRGIGELTPGTGQVGQLEPLFQATREAGNLPLWVHTFFPLQLTDIQELLRLAQKYPSVPLILGHLGGIHWLATIKAIRDLSNVYLDLSATFTTLAPSFAVKEYPERVLFSSDAPYGSPLAARTILEQIIPDRSVLEQVLGGNIAQLLHL